MKIKFVVSKRRKGSTESKFNATLSDYWQQQYNDMFRWWKGELSSVRRKDESK